MLRIRLTFTAGLLAMILGCSSGNSRGATGAIVTSAPTALTGNDLNQLVSFQVTTAGYTDRFLRHQNGVAVTSPVNSSSDDLSKQDATFWVRPGLANSSCYSFESRNYAGQFLRHSNYRLRKDASDGSDLFKADATFCPKTGLSGMGTSFESFNYPDRYIRHINSEVYIAQSSGSNPWDGGGSFNADASWSVVDGLWRSGADLAVDQLKTLQVVTSGYTDRVLRHQDGVAVTSPINSSSDDLSRQDATFYVRRGLADSSCYSFESLNYGGQYLRHANFRVRKDANDNSDLFKSDATFCAQPGLNGGNVSLVAYALAGKYIRHKNAEVWVGAASGSDPGDGGDSGFAADATWKVIDGLASGNGGGWPALPPRSDGKWVRVKNGCSFPIWIHAASAPDQGNIILPPDDAQLASGAHQDYLAPNQWSSARVTAYTSGPRNGEIEKAELTINPTLNYNVTYVDWVGLPLEVVGVGGNCTASEHTTGCYAKQNQITSGCPESFLLQGNQCISPRTYCANPANQGSWYCHALDSAIANCASCPKDTTTNVYMCANLYQNEPRWCAALNRGMTSDPDNSNSALYYQNPPYNTYAKWVHQFCPNIYAFSYDDHLGQGGFRSCSGDEVRITFCPNG